MNELQVFEKKEFGKVRTVEVDGEVWFVGKDVCKVFGDTNHIRSLARVDDEDKRTIEIKDSLGRKQNAIVVNESGLYALLFAMQPQKANGNDGVQDAYPIEVQERIDKIRQFKRWVTHDVLPSIRQHGGYIAGQETLNTEELQKVLDVVEMMKGKLEAQKPLVDFALHVSESADSVDFGTFAKIVQDDSIPIGRNRLFQWFRKNHYIMEDGTPYQWVLNGKYMQLVEKTYTTAYGKKIFTKAYITGKGQIYFLEKLKKQIEILGHVY